MIMYTAKQLEGMDRKQLMDVADDLGIDFEPSDPRFTLIELIQRKYEEIGLEEAEAVDLAMEFQGIPVFVLDEFEEIRLSGVINMFDRRGFEQVCSSETLSWLTDGEGPRKNYGMLLSAVSAYMQLKRNRK